METKLYVGNLSYDTTEDGLREAFAKAGTVALVEIIKDRDTGRMKGFAFVTMGAGALQGLCFAFMWVVSMYQLWFSRPPPGRRASSHNRAAVARRVGARQSPAAAG